MNIPAGITLGTQNQQFADRFHVEFDLLAVEKWSDEEGRKVLVDKERAIITLPGGKNVHRKIITDELLDEWRNGKWRNGQMIKGPAPWAIHAYEQWRQGNEIPEHGTPLKNWPPVTPSFLKTCLAANVRTVEDLAGLNDDGMKRLGIGALNWKRQAHEWLNAANNQGFKDAGRVAALETRMESLEGTIREQHDVIKALQEENRKLRNGEQSVPVPQTHVPEQPAVSGDPVAEYERIFGKKPHHKMKPETMLRRIEEARAQ